MRKCRVIPIGPQSCDARSPMKLQKTWSRSIEGIHFRFCAGIYILCSYFVTELQARALLMS